MSRSVVEHGEDRLRREETEENDVEGGAIDDDVVENDDDAELNNKIRFRVAFLRDEVQKAREQGAILEQHLVRFETLYERATSEVIRWQKTVHYGSEQPEFGTANLRIRLAIFNEVRMAFFQYAERCYTKMRKYENILDYLLRTSTLAALTWHTTPMPSLRHAVPVSTTDAASSAASSEEIVEDLRNIHLETDDQL